ncbi:hypothetical protein [Isoalcanivorax beigongshangi]|uniref:N-acetyltransferase domain-containing protein n=1 Tax=Isoalcanivorax beigongshangi TaxID=3238810 RepID=A0ABV4AIX8_9GAMM
MKHCNGVACRIDASGLIAPIVAPLPAAELREVAAFSLLRHTKGFDRNPESCALVIAEQLQQWLHSSAAVWGLRDHLGHLQALCALVPLAWDSAHFGQPMARLQLLRSTGVAETDCARLVDCALATESGHLSAEVDVADYLSFNLLARRGFELLDTRRTYCAYAPRKPQLGRRRQGIRPYRTADRAAVLEIVADTRFPSRFYRDDGLAPARVAAMYHQWFARLLDDHGRSSDAVVYEREGQVLACGAIGERDFSAAGVPLRARTGSLYAGLPSATGAYLPVLEMLISRALETYDFAETTVALQNTAACRALESFTAVYATATSYSLRRRPLG